MTSLDDLKDIEKAVERLSPDKLAQFRAWFEDFEIARFTNDGFYIASQEELSGIDRGLRDAAEGKFATPEEVEATFGKYR